MFLALTPVLVNIALNRAKSRRAPHYGEQCAGEEVISTAFPLTALPISFGQSLRFLPGEQSRDARLGIGGYLKDYEAYLSLQVEFSPSICLY